MTTQPFGDNPRLRASDADRDRAASVLNGAMAEGRLTVDEHADRLDALYSAKTHAEIVPLLDDLPERAAAAALARPDGIELDFRDAILPGGDITIAATCILGGMEITVPPEMQVIDSGVAILGGREIAGASEESIRPGAPVLRISGFCLLGGVEVKRKSRKGQRGIDGRRGITS
jgi:hypothetical protein